MEETPVMEAGPVKGVTVSGAVTAAMEDRGRTKAAAAEAGPCAKATTADRKPAAPESAAAKCCATTSETAAAKCRATTSETAAANCRAASTETAAANSAAAEATSTAATAAARCLNLGRQAVDYKFR